MQRLLDADAGERFQIYLNDHRGLLAAEGEMATRSHRSNRDSAADADLVGLLAAIAAQNHSDATRLDELLGEVGGRPNPLKTLAARLGERFGRLKLNGQLKGYSPLSRVVELEALLASTAVRRAMWNSIAAVAPNLDIVDSVSLRNDANQRAEVVDEHHERLANHHLDAVYTALAGEQDAESSTG